MKSLENKIGVGGGGRGYFPGIRMKTTGEGWDGTSLSAHAHSVKGAVSRNSAKLGNCKMPVKLRET